MMEDPTKIKERVERALQLAGQAPWLVAYDANGIQQFVTASSRPIAMRGASETIKSFDEWVAKSDMSIFAGGGRGVELARSEAEAKDRMKALVTEFKTRTHGGVLATAAVPYDRGATQASLAWLRLKLDVAKDEAPAPGGSLPADKQGQCADCKEYRAEHKSPREDDGGERVCPRCRAMVNAGRQTGESRQSLVDIATNGRIAAISADGNNLGVFFKSLESLEELAAASHAVASIFAAAHEQALGSLSGKHVPLVTGGDDIRLFLAPEDVLPYVEALVRGVEQQAARSEHHGGALQPARAEALKKLGVGIGAVVAGDHYPASRLMEYAHALEDSAKKKCRAPSGNAGAGARSAFDFAILTSAGSPSVDARSSNDIRPIDMAEGQWSRLRQAAKALRNVPTAQRAIVAEERTLSEEEFANLFRYQVVRSKEWQAWYDACKLNWRDAGAVYKDRPAPGLIELIDLLGKKS